jgi:hypothetical protein
VGAPDSTIAYQRSETHSRYVGALSLRLPPEYTLIRRDHRPAGGEVVGGLIVASWYAAGSGQPGRHPLGVSAWVVPEFGFPTVGAPPHTQQVTFAECATGDRPVRGARVAVFTLVTGADTTAYLAAVWPVGNGRRLQVVASAPRVAQLHPVRRALLDAVTEPSTER